MGCAMGTLSEEKHTHIMSLLYLRYVDGILIAELKNLKLLKSNVRSKKCMFYTG